MLSVVGDLEHSVEPEVPEYFPDQRTKSVENESSAGTRSFKPMDRWLKQETVAAKFWVLASHG